MKVRSGALGSALLAAQSVRAIELNLDDNGTADKNHGFGSKSETANAGR